MFLLLEKGIKRSLRLWVCPAGGFKSLRLLIALERSLGCRSKISGRSLLWINFLAKGDEDVLQIADLDRCG